MRHYLLHCKHGLNCVSKCYIFSRAQIKFFFWLIHYSYLTTFFSDIGHMTCMSTTKTASILRIMLISSIRCSTWHCVKSVQTRSYFWSIFSCIGTEYRKIRTRKTPNLRIRSEYRKMWTRNNSVFGHFSRSMVVIEQNNIKELI